MAVWRNFRLRRTFFKKAQTVSICDKMDEIKKTVFYFFLMCLTTKKQFLITA